MLCLKKYWMNMRVYCSKTLAVALPLMLAIGLTACHRKQEVAVVSVHSNEAAEEQFDPYVEGNKRILALETEEIELVVKRHHWNMQSTGTGLYYEVLSPGTGPCYAEGDSVALKYTIALLSGTVVYDSEADGIKTFRVEKSEEIPALHEMARLVSPGAKVRMVVPSHLAYGAGGDGNKIKGREALIMNVEFLNH